MKSKFTGGLFGLIGISFLQILLCIVTLGIGTPWAVCMRLRWYAKHTVLDGRQVVFDGKGIQLLGNYLKWFLLAIITLGIYAFWWGIKMTKWQVSHTHQIALAEYAY